MIPLLAMLACDPRPAHCRDRADDADCDGVPDAADRCPDSDPGLHDAVGCTDAQAAGCTVELLVPADGAAIAGDERFAWNGTCDVYLLQLCDDPTFPPGATRTAARTAGTEVLSSGRERYWRVVGGMHGASAGFATAPRALEAE